MNKKLVLIVAVGLLFLLVLGFALQRVLFKPQQAPRAKVSIVIDDWGYNLYYLDLLQQIDAPITISILPNLSYSARVAEAVQAQGQQVILHLPLQPELDGRGYIGLEKNTITASMSEQQVIDQVNLALASVPDARGVSNHMGSRATRDSRLMSIIFAELKKRKLFFLDNLVTEQSVCRQLAAEAGVQFATRDFFLDNSDHPEYINSQLKKLAEFALAKGEAVAIGHAKENTLTVLKEQIPVLKQQGISFVFVSELVK